jgi:hypothetical protein
MPQQRTPLALAVTAALIAALCSGVIAAPASASMRPAAATAAAGTVTWGRAVKDNSVAALNDSNDAGVSALSCGAPGNCAAGGSYQVAGQSASEAFVMNEVKGRWSSAEEVPGIAPLNTGGSSTIMTVSCAAAGDCSAGGSYLDGDTHQQAFLVTESNGTWGTAVQVPGSATLNLGGHAQVDDISCAEPGDCSAAGIYLPGSGQQQVFVISEVNGTWGTAQEAPGLAALGTEYGVTPIAISCAAPGSCSLGGEYTPGTAFEAFVISQVAGVWSQAEEIPGSAAFGGIVNFRALSCYSAGCTASGMYFDQNGSVRNFVASEVGDTWRAAQTLSARAGQFLTLSCQSAGNCSAGGQVGLQPVVATEKRGMWGKPEVAPGSAALKNNVVAAISSISCWSAGNCSAVGGYRGNLGGTQVFVLDETHGVWGKTIEIPGTAALDAKRKGYVAGVSCIQATCTAVGGYKNASGEHLVFVAKAK